MQVLMMKPWVFGSIFVGAIALSYGVQVAF